jgi:hypothetical protein
VKDPKMQKFIKELDISKMPYLIDGQNIACGGSVMFTKTETGYRLEAPTTMTVEREFPYAVLFITTLVGTGVLTSIGGTIKRFFFEGVPFERDIEGYKLRAFVENAILVILADPIQTARLVHPK